MLLPKLAERKASAKNALRDPSEAREAEVSGFEPWRRAVLDVNSEDPQRWEGASFQALLSRGTAVTGLEGSEGIGGVYGFNFRFREKLKLRDDRGLVGEGEGRGEIWVWEVVKCFRL